jgi:hypothetical protein
MAARGGQLILQDVLSFFARGGLHLQKKILLSELALTSKGCTALTTSRILG